MGTALQTTTPLVDVDKIMSSSMSINLLAALARLIPRAAGHKLADLIAGGLAQQRNSRLMRAMRVNQWVARGEPRDRMAVDQAAREALSNSGRSIFDLYHYLWNLMAAGSLIAVDDAGRRLISRLEFDARGLMVTGIHLSSFDLALRWLCLQGIKPLVLTVPNQEGGRRIEYEMRRRGGMNLVPATVAGLRHAMRHLQSGGAVLTGIDRPITNVRLKPAFFGRPADLPVHHVILAMRAGVPGVLAAVVLEADGKYHLRVSEILEMPGDPRRDEDVLRNAERLLHAAEDMIRKTPGQWSVPLPVWPSAMKLVPA